MTQRSNQSNSPKATAPVPSHAASQYDDNPSGIAIGLTLSLSWQLAIVVLVPILGGHYLDDWLKTAPWFTLAGFAFAMVSMIVVVRRVLVQLNETMKQSADEKPEGNKK